MNRNTWFARSVYCAPEGGTAPAAGGGTEAPAATTPASDGDGGSDVNTDWGAMASDDDGGGTDIGDAAGLDPAPPATQAPATPPAVPNASVAAEQPQVQPPATQPQSPQEPAQVQQPAAAEQPVDIGKLRADYEQQLVQHYQLLPEDAARLQTEPELVLPTLAARVHLEVLDAISAQIPHRVTAIVQNIMETTKRETAAKDDFYSAYPDLRAHEDAVLRVGAMFRAANPKASKELTIKTIGDFVRQSLGLSAPAAVAQAPQTQQNVFTPAAPVASGAPAAQPSIWEQMAADEDD